MRVRANYEISKDLRIEDGLLFVALCKEFIIDHCMYCAANKPDPSIHSIHPILSHHIPSYPKLQAIITLDKD